MHFKKYSIYDISIVPLIAVKSLAEPCRKSSRLTFGIKMPQHNALNAEMTEKSNSVRKIHERFLHKS